MQVLVAFGVEGLGRAHGVAPVQVEGRVDHDAVQPRRHGRVAAERAGATEGRDQPFLQGIGREVGVARGAQRHGVEPVAVTGEELAERRRIPGHVGGEQRGVIAMVARVGHSGTVHRGRGHVKDRRGPPLVSRTR